MSKITKIERALVVSYITPCQHRDPPCSYREPPSRVPLEPVDILAMSKALQKASLWWCPECSKGKVPPIEATGSLIAQHRFTQHMSLDCGHSVNIGIPFHKSNLIEPFLAIVVGDETSCAECSSDKAVELEKANAVDMDSATRRYHDTVNERVEKGEAVLKPLEYIDGYVPAAPSSPTLGADDALLESTVIKEVQVTVPVDAAVIKLDVKI